MMKQGNLKLTTVILLLFFTNLFSQNWTPIADMGDSRYGAVSFSIGEKGYVAIGQTYTTTKSSVWEYNPSNNTWTQKADFGGGNRRVAFGFSIGNKGYVGAGRDDSGTNGNGILHNDFWEFNPSTNIWTQKANFGGGTRENLTSFVIGDFGYAGLGLRGSRKYDFWKYDPNNDIWIELQEIDPNLHFYNSTSFVLNGFAYYGLGSGFDWVNYNNYTSNKIVKYNPTDDTWSQINNFSGSARINATSFVLNNKAYIGLGRLGGNGAYLDDLWEYNDVDDNWQETIVTGLTRSRVSTFTLNNKAYLGNGVSSTQHHQDFYVLDNISLSISEQNLQSDFRIFSFEKNIKILFNQDGNSTYQIAVYNINGKEIFNKSFISENKKIIIPHKINKGLYIIKIENINNGNKFNKKIIIN